MGSINPFRFEELTTVAGFLIDSLTRDLADFGTYSEIYRQDFLNNLIAKKDEVERITRTKSLLNQITNITLSLYDKVESLRPKISNLEGYIVLAKKNLVSQPKNFGLKEVRDKIHRRDVEGLLDKLAITLAEVDITENLAALNAVGFKAPARAELTTIKDDINNKNKEQNLKIDEKEEVVRANLVILLELWEILKMVMDSGKRIYKYTNKQRAEDYTATKILGRIRHEYTKGNNGEPVIEKGILEITVYEKATENPLEEATVEIKETKDVLTTDSEGECGKDLPVGSYTVSAMMDGYNTMTVLNVVIKKDEATDLDFDLEPEGE